MLAAKTKQAKSAENVRKAKRSYRSYQWKQHADGPLVVLLVACSQIAFYAIVSAFDVPCALRPSICTAGALRAHCGHMYQRTPKGEGGNIKAGAATQQNNLILTSSKTSVLTITNPNCNCAKAYKRGTCSNDTCHTDIYHYGAHRDHNKQCYHVVSSCRCHHEHQFKNRRTIHECAKGLLHPKSLHLLWSLA